MKGLLQNQKVVKEKKRRPLFYVMIFSLLLILGSFHLISSSPSSEEIRLDYLQSPSTSGAVPDRASSSLKPMEDAGVRKIPGKIKKNQTFYDLMLAYDVAPFQIQRMASAAKGVFNLRRLLPGRSYELALDDAGKFQWIRYTVDPENSLVIEAMEDGYDAFMEEIPFEIYIKRKQGVITSTLFEAVESLGEGPELAVKLSEIFAWDIDFHFDTRKGDRFTVLFEEKWKDGAFYGYGNILAAEFVNQGDLLSAVYFEGSGGKSGYFTPQGKSLQKQFLRSPLKFSRISSKFTYKRFHPVLKRYRPHLGVDYVAPVGTPVHAAGDGKIIFAGRKGGNGKFVKIRHNQIYMTGYLHLSRIAKGIRSGKKVQQGQVIGHVGQTGLATGPHLCYRFYKYGKFANPLTVKFPSASPVAKKDLEKFREVQERWMARLQRRSPVYLVDRNDYLVAGRVSLQALPHT